MEQHPVPQNVTTFQFRLVGDMTIRQFGYLAGGIILAYICYKLPLPFFFTWPLAITSGLLGFGLAFVPVEERPMDVWIASFFKNVYNPTQWVWQKERRTQNTQEVVLRTQDNLLKPAPAPSSRVILTMHRATNPLEWLRSLFHAKPKPASPSLTPGFSFADAFSRQEAPQKPPPPPAPPIQPATVPQAAQPTPQPNPAPNERIVELQTQLSDALAQRERLEKELINIRRHLDQQAKPVQPVPLRQAGVVTPASTAPATSVRIIAPEAAAKAGLPRLTTFPNVVTGLVKDHWGNFLSGMLVTVRDKDDVPLRALKTNKLGQFAASTPLPNGTYIVEIEDPKAGFVFDKVQINLTGAVAPAIEVIAKSQKQVERDKLAREIFGDQQNEFTITKSQ